MDGQSKKSRKRVANFTSEEKALLAQLIEKTPIVESKLIDGKSVAQKQAAWAMITREFNSNTGVPKRETITLKRAWDNMKAFTRKSRATDQGNSLNTEGESHEFPPTPQFGEIISMVEEATPAMICEVKNNFGSDGTNYYRLPKKEEGLYSTRVPGTENMDSEESMNFGAQENYENGTSQIEDSTRTKTKDQVRKTTDYIRKEAIMRIKHFENKKKMEMQILATQLEYEHIKKRAALLEEERNITLLEKAKLELEEVKKLIGSK